MMANLYLQKIIFEEVEKYLEENPDQAQKIMRQNIATHTRILTVLKHLVDGIQSVKNIDSGMKEQLVNAAELLKKNDTPAFFNEILKVPADKINGANAIFKVVKNLGNIEARQAQMMLDTSKKNIAALVQIGTNKLAELHKSQKNPEPQPKSVQPQSSTSRKTADIHNNQPHDTVVTEQGDENQNQVLKGAKMEIEKFKKYLDTHLNLLMTAGKDLTTGELLQREMNGLQSSLDSVMGVLEKHIGSSDKPDPGNAIRPKKILPDPPEPPEYDKESTLEESVRKVVQNLEKNAVKWQLLSNKRKEQGRVEAAELATEKAKKFSLKANELKKNGKQ